MKLNERERHQLERTGCKQTCEATFQLTPGLKKDRTFDSSTLSA